MEIQILSLREGDMKLDNVKGKGFRKNRKLQFTKKETENVSIRRKINLAFKMVSFFTIILGLMSINSLHRIYQNIDFTSSKLIQTQYQTAVISNVIVFLLFAAVWIIVGRVLSRGNGVPPMDVVQSVESVTKGNLTVKLVEGIRDEEEENFIKTYNNMLDSLVNMISQVKKISYKMSIFSIQLSDMARKAKLISNHVSDTASQLVQEAASQTQEEMGTGFNTDQISQKIQQIALTGDRIKKAAAQITNHVQKGHQQVEQVVIKMKKCKQNLVSNSDKQAVSTSEKELIENIEQVSEIANTFNIIIQQTAEMHVEVDQGMYVVQNMIMGSQQMIEAAMGISAIVQSATGSTHEQTVIIDTVVKLAQEQANMAKDLEQCIEKYKI